MEVGLQFIFQNTHDGMSDAEMMRKETEIAILAEEVGMDFVLLPEHHFDPNYAMMPDNMQWLSYLAGKTSRIKLGTGAIILPWWNNPTRVAEKISMLQALLGDRFMLGFGRGLAREEYEAFDIDNVVSEVVVRLVQHRMSDWAVWDWFETPNTWLDNNTPASSLAVGDVKAVRRAVAGLFQE